MVENVVSLGDQLAISWQSLPKSNTIAIRCQQVARLTDEEPEVGHRLQPSDRGADLFTKEPARAPASSLLPEQGRGSGTCRSWQASIRVSVSDCVSAEDAHVARRSSA
jgi:hypothetical protein